MSAPFRGRYPTACEAMDSGHGLWNCPADEPPSAVLLGSSHDSGGTDLDRCVAILLTASQADARSYAGTSTQLCDKSHVQQRSGNVDDFPHVGSILTARLSILGLS